MDEWWIMRKLPNLYEIKLFKRIETLWAIFKTLFLRSNHPVSIKEIHIFLNQVLRYYLILESFHCGFGGPAGGFGGSAGGFGGLVCIFGGADGFGGLVTRRFRWWRLVCWRKFYQTWFEETQKKSIYKLNRDRKLIFET